MTETTAKTVDLSTVNFDDAPTYRKKVVVSARPATEGELLVTTLADGTEETRQTLTSEHMVVTNPGGEEYAILREKFATLYEEIGDGRYLSVGRIKALPNPYGEPIEIDAPWGGRQVGGADCWLAQNGSSRYLIGGSEFLETYALLGEEE